MILRTVVRVYFKYAFNCPSTSSSIQTLISELKKINVNTTFPYSNKTNTRPERKSLIHRSFHPMLVLFRTEGWLWGLEWPRWMALILVAYEDGHSVPEPCKSWEILYNHWKEESFDPTLWIFLAPLWFLNILYLHRSCHYIQKVGRCLCLWLKRELLKRRNLASFQG